MQASRSVRAGQTVSCHDRSLAMLLVGFLVSCYLFTYTGLIQSSDGLAMFATAESIVRRGEVDANQLLWMGLQQGSFGPDGDLYSRKGAGMTLLALPLVWLAHQWTALGLVQTALLLNPLLTAWTAGLLYGASVRLGWRRPLAVVTALVYGLATPAWPYTQTFFSDPMAGWGLFAALYGLLVYSQNGRRRALLLGGLAWGLAYLARSVNLVTLPIYVLALGMLLYDKQKEEKPPAGGVGMVWIGSWVRFPITSTLTRYLPEWLLFALPVLLAGGVSLWWNWLRYGHPLETGYLSVESFNGDWLFGIYGLLLSPARGIVWYSPVLLLAPLGIGWFWRRQRWLCGAVLGLALLYLLVYGKWFMWHGGFSWGPRFLVPVLPGLLLLTAPVWQRVHGQNVRAGSTWRERIWRRGAALGVALLLVLSIAVQWLGLLVPFGLVQEWLAGEVAPLFAPETFAHLRYSPLLHQGRYLRGEHVHFAWWKAGSNGPDWLACGLLAGTVGVGAWLIGRQMRGAAADGEVLPHWIYPLALLLGALAVLIRYQGPLSGPANLALAQRIQAQEEAGDAILHLRPAESQGFANAYHGNLPVYGFPPDQPPNGAGDRLAERYRRLWVIPAAELPEQSAWERGLRSSAFLLLDDQLDGQRLALYALPSAQSLTEAGVGVHFGEPAWVRLNSYSITERTAPGDELLIALEWESLRPVAENYQVFVHLLDEAGNRLAQRDGQPVLWLRPTSTWQPGEHILDRYGLLLPADLPPGRYHVLVGLYDPASGVRQPATAGPDHAVRLGPIGVESR